MKLERVRKLIAAGQCDLFNNWHEIGQVSEKEFLEGYVWLSKDPFDEKDRITRDLGLEVTKDAVIKYRLDHDPEGTKMIPLTAADYDPSNLKGKLVKLHRTYTVDGIPKFFLDQDGHNGQMYEGHLICNIRTHLYNLHQSN